MKQNKNHNRLNETKIKYIQTVVTAVRSSSSLVGEERFGKGPCCHGVKVSGGKSQDHFVRKCVFHLL